MSMTKTMLLTRTLSLLRKRNLQSIVSLTTTCIDDKHHSQTWPRASDLRCISIVKRITLKNSELYCTAKIGCRQFSTLKDDTAQSSWESIVDRTVTPSLLPYVKLMRLDKPTGTWLLLLPSLWGISIATPAGCLPSISIMSLFTMGAILMRGAGCTINDLWDKSYDKRVSRTKSRPLASDQLLNSDAVFFLAGQLGASVLILSTFDLNSMIIGASSMILVSTYPAFKRFTNWPQLVLGATFNWGVLLGSSVATAGDLSFIPMILPLYAAGICWTVVYDTIYAHQDKIDDSLIGLKSTALTFGKNTKTWLSLFSAGMVSNLLLTGYLTDQMWPFYAAVAATGLHFAFQIRELNIDDVDNCWKLFKRNSQVGVILLIGIILSTLIKDKQKPSDTIVNNNKSV